MASDVEAVAIVYVTITPSARRRRLAAVIVTVTDDSSTPAVNAIASRKTSLLSSASATVRPENVMSPVTTGAAVGLGTGATVGNGVGGGAVGG